MDHEYNSKFDYKTLINNLAKNSNPVNEFNKSVSDMSNRSKKREPFKFITSAINAVKLSIPAFNKGIIKPTIIAPQLKMTKTSYQTPIVIKNQP